MNLLEHKMLELAFFNFTHILTSNFVYIWGYLKTITQLFSFRCSFDSQNSRSNEAD